MRFDLGEREVLRFFQDSGIPALKVAGFDILAKILGEYYAIEVKRNDVKGRRAWVITIHVNSWKMQMKLADEFGWNRILIFINKNLGEYVLEELEWIDKQIEKKTTRQAAFGIKGKDKIPLKEWLNAVTNLTTLISVKSKKHVDKTKYWKLKAYKEPLWGYRGFLWRYIAKMDEGTCTICRKYNNQAFTPQEMIREFPNLSTQTKDIRLPIVHRNCRCKLFGFVPQNT